MRDGEPYTESIGTRWYPDCVLTHAIWHNSMGSNEPETGIRTVEEGTVIADTFNLVQHYTRDFDLAERIIVRAYRKGWGMHRAATLIEWLGNRRKLLLLRAILPSYPPAPSSRT